jgi:RimJ/RimL family protein N-acetyltransferase
MTVVPPDRVELDNHTALRLLTVDDADAVARAVGESLDHLKPWMPWADARSADPAFQRNRLRDQPHRAGQPHEWQYGLFDAATDELVGAFGLMTRRGPRTFEIGYWLHVDRGGRGLATAAAGALTEVGLALEGIDQMIIVCDEANARSAAIPQRLGYALDRVEIRPPEAPGETGRMQFWVADRRSSPPTPTP